MIKIIDYSIGAIFVCSNRMLLSGQRETRGECQSILGAASGTLLVFSERDTGDTSSG